MYTTEEKVYYVEAMIREALNYSRASSLPGWPVFHKGFLSEFTVSGFCCHAEKFSVFTEAAMNECLSFNHLLSRA